MKIFTGLVSTLVLFSAGAAYSQSRLPSVRDIKQAQKKIEFVSQDLRELIANPVGHVVGGGGQVEPVDCRAIRTQRDCKIAYEFCTWIEDFEAPRCESKVELPFFENDFLAERMAVALEKETNRFAGDLEELADLRESNDPEVVVEHGKACLKVSALIVANESAKRAAAAPLRGNYDPEFFEEYSEALDDSQTSLKCF